jgi:hypothetical protein
MVHISEFSKKNRVPFHDELEDEDTHNEDNSLSDIGLDFEIDLKSRGKKKSSLGHTFISQKNRKNNHEESFHYFDLDSPYQGDDKFDLDIDGKDTPLNNASVIDVEYDFPRKLKESGNKQKKKTFETLDKDFIFGNESPLEKGGSKIPIAEESGSLGIESSDKETLGDSKIDIEFSSNKKILTERVSFKEPLHKHEDRVSLKFVERPQYTDEKLSQKESQKSEISSPKGDNSDIPSPEEINFHRDPREDEDILSPKEKGTIDVEDSHKKYDEIKPLLDFRNEDFLIDLSQEHKEESNQKGQHSSPSRLIVEESDGHENDDLSQDLEKDNRKQSRFDMKHLDKRHEENHYSYDIHNHQQDESKALDDSIVRSNEKSSEKSVNFGDCVVDLMDEPTNIHTETDKYQEIRVNEEGARQRPTHEEAFAYKILRIRVPEPKKRRGFKIVLQKIVKSEVPRAALDESSPQENEEKSDKKELDDPESFFEINQSKYSNFYNDEVPRRSLREKKDKPKNYDQEYG